MYDILKNISFARGLSIFCIGFCNLISPFWYLFQFEPLLFERLDTIRLLLLSAGFGFPLSFITYASTFAINELYNEESSSLDANNTEEVAVEMNTDEVFTQLALSSILAAFGLYITCCFKFLDNSYHEQRSILSLTIFYGVIVIPSLFSAIKRRNKLKRNQKINDPQNK
jgi:hypothetical protein